MTTFPMDNSQQLLAYLQAWRQLLEVSATMAPGMTPGLPFPTVPMAMPPMPPAPSPPMPPTAPSPTDYTQHLFGYLQAWRQYLEQATGASPAPQQPPTATAPAPTSQPEPVPPNNPSANQVDAGNSYPDSSWPTYETTPVNPGWNTASPRSLFGLGRDVTPSPGGSPTGSGAGRGPQATPVVPGDSGGGQTTKDSDAASGSVTPVPPTDDYGTVGFPTSDLGRRLGRDWPPNEVIQPRDFGGSQIPLERHIGSPFRGGPDAFGSAASQQGAPSLYSIGSPAAAAALRSPDAGLTRRAGVASDSSRVVGTNQLRRQRAAAAQVEVVAPDYEAGR